MLQRMAQVAAAMIWCLPENIPHHTQHMPVAFGGGYVFFHTLGKQRKANLVVVALGGKGEHGTDFGGQFALGLAAAAKGARGTQVDHEHDGEFAFLNVLLNEWLVQPGSDVPVDVTHLVAGLIFPDVIEVHALTLEDTLVLADHQIADQPAGADLDLPYLSLEFGQVHGLGHGQVIEQQLHDLFAAFLLRLGFVGHMHAMA